MLASMTTTKLDADKIKMALAAVHANEKAHGTLASAKHAASVLALNEGEKAILFSALHLAA